MSADPAWKKSEGQTWECGVAWRAAVISVRLVFDKGTGSVVGGGGREDEMCRAVLLPILHVPTEMGDVDMLVGSGKDVNAAVNWDHTTIQVKADTSTRRTRTPPPASMGVMRRQGTR